MAALNAAQFFGQFLRAPTAADLDTLRAYAKGLGYVPLPQYAQFPASIFPLVLVLPSDPNNTTVESLPVSMPFPARLWGADLGCLTAAGGTCTADIQRKVGAGAYATVFTAAKDIKTPAGAFTRYQPETTASDWAFGDLIKLVVVGGGAGAVVGSRATLWLQML